VAGAREPFVDACAIEQFEARRASDRFSRALGNDAQLLLRPGECRLDIEPSLPAVF